MAHEWGHTRGLNHVFDGARASSAIMYWQSGGGLRNQINQTEADYLRANQSIRPPEP